jgi:hypothetical protein
VLIVLVHYIIHVRWCDKTIAQSGKFEFSVVHYRTSQLSEVYQRKEIEFHNLNCVQDFAVLTNKQYESHGLRYDARRRGCREGGVM